MPTFAEVYNNAPAPSVHSTRFPSKSSHPTSTSHIPADAKPIDFRRMSSSKAGMGRTRGTERGSKPDEAPEGPEFASRTRDVGNSDGGLSPPTESPMGKRAVLASLEKRRPSSGSAVEDAAGTSDAVDPLDRLPIPDDNHERRGSFANMFKKIF